MFLPEETFATRCKVVLAGALIYGALWPAVQALDFCQWVGRGFRRKAFRGSSNIKQPPPDTTSDQYEIDSPGPNTRRFDFTGNRGGQPHRELSLPEFHPSVWASPINAGYCFALLVTLFAVALTAGVITELWKP